VAVAASKRSTLVAATLASGITSLPTTALGVALPTLHAEFQATLSELQWTLTAYSLTYAALLIVAGRLADVFGRRRLFVAGATVFGVGSVAAALADSPLWLICSLGVIGVGGAMLVPASLALVTQAFAGAGRTRGIAIWGGASGLISGLGPPIGGVLTDELSWRWIFWLGAAVAGGIVLLATRVLESRDEKADRTMDVGGVVCLAGGISLLSLPLIEASGWGWTSVPTLVSFAVAVVLLAAFIPIELRARSPIFELDLFRYRNFVAGGLLKFSMNFVLASLFFLLPIYMQELLGYSPVKSGLLLLPLTAGFVAGLPLGGRLLDRVGPKTPMLAGLALMAAGVYFLADLSTTASTFQFWFPLLVLGLGLGVVLTPINAASVNAVPTEKHGEAAGILTTLIGLGSVMGVAVCGAVFKELEDAKLEHVLAGTRFNEHDERLLEGILAHSQTAQQHLHGFGPLEGTVMHAWREAFRYGTETTLRLSAGMLVVVIVLIALIVRSARRAWAISPAPDLS
jgi:EmrB/QacA subfamily drug resistance transporter